MFVKEEEEEEEEEEAIYISLHVAPPQCKTIQTTTYSTRPPS
jgi:hypothetical protein